MPLKTKEEELETIKVYGAKEHNLKNINVTIPRDKLTVITGLSGSGKSSLAFDTLFAEGQRRYIECLSSNAKQYLNMMKKPDVDRIEGLSPAISIEQKTLSNSPRSTVGTVTEIYDFLRLLFTKIGIQYSVEHNVPVVQRSKDQILNEIISDYDGKKIMILAPVIRGRKGHYRELFEQFRKQGFTKVRVDGNVKDIEPGMQLSRYKIHDIELVLDRLIPSKEIENRINESVELALKKGDGVIYVLSQMSRDWEEKTYSIHYTCPISGEAYSKLAPNKFSFNSGYGACDKCDGLGYLLDFDKSLLIEDEDKSISRGGLAFVDKRNSVIYKQIDKISSKIDLDMKKPISEIKKETLDLIFNGTEDLEIDSEYSFGGDKISYKHSFSGLIPILEHQYETANPPKRKRMQKYMTQHTCKQCSGGRLKQRSLFVRINDKNIYDVSSMNITEAKDFIKSIPKSVEKRKLALAKVIITQIIDRLEFLEEVGLNYLTLSRSSKSLSGGESQRIRLASQIGSRLVGIMYVLDEPSIGLHQHDNNKLIESLKKLRDLGNTLIVVEHDKQMIIESDYLIDIGPGAGVQGGEILVSDKPVDAVKKKNKDSHTIKYLNNTDYLTQKIKRREGNKKKLELHGAKGNNLKDVKLSLPLGKFITITGMSGSGKSSLINDTLVPILKRKFTVSKAKPLEYDKIKGIDNIDKVIEIDQTPIGKTPRSNPATYTGLFTLIRDFYAQLPEAKIRGYNTGRFSFNVQGGRCEECQGAGMKKIEMNFLPDVYVQCDVCNGKRYNQETLQVKYKGKSIADVLSMPISESLQYFDKIPKIKRKLKILNDVGLGYLTLGQQSPTLSGGEAQRIKLSTELSKRSTGKTLFLLDEPTTGLHFEDINLLLKLLNKLADKGNTVVVIEHNLDVIHSSDWIIDMGPMGGDEGGDIIFEGTPEKIIKDKKSLTGKYLKEEFK
jgi:excinuclease ABC subunit A